MPNWREAKEKEEEEEEERRKLIFPTFAFEKQRRGAGGRVRVSACSSFDSSSSSNPSVGGIQRRGGQLPG